MMTQKKPAAMFLEVTFDIDQTSDQLGWHFWRADGHADPRQGKDKGIINFTAGETFYVGLKGGSKQPFKGFRIIDCSIITKPFVYICGPDIDTVYAPPSPFTSDATMGAVVNLPATQFQPAEAGALEHYYVKAQNWSGFLTVGQFEARWELSFVVTVEITRDNGSKVLRVFSFDPEGEVTNGVVPPMAQGVSAMPEVDPSSGGI